MTDIKRIKNNAKALLERAHSLENESQTKTLYRDWAQTYDTTMIDGFGIYRLKKERKYWDRKSVV